MNLPKTRLEELRYGTTKDTDNGFKTAINKQPHNSAHIEMLGLVGDQQTESFHGGTEQAVLQYDAAHYPKLQKEFPDSAEYFVQGGYGENLVATGMNEATMCIGDKVKVGTVLLEVSGPRQPCFKLNYRFNEATISRFTQHLGMSGWYYRVLETGEVKVGDSIEVIERPNPEWSIAKIQYYLYTETDNQQAMEKLTQLVTLNPEIRKLFQKRLDTQQVENWKFRLEGRTEFIKK